MASNNINENEPIDLLLISSTLDNIIKDNVVGDKDYGMHYNYLYIGMSGQRFVDQTNSNWEATDAQFLAHYNAINARIVSNAIKEIKLDNDILYYTTEVSTDSDEDTRTWIPVESSWGKIVGNIADQKDLQEVLSTKVSNTEFNKLSTTVSNNSNTLIDLSTTVNDIGTLLTSLSTQINGANGIALRLTTAENTLKRAILSGEVRGIRTTPDGFLEYTTNNVDWHSVSSVGTIEWGNISGDIDNQPDLKLRFTNVDKLIQSCISDLKSHIRDDSNPHKVTKKQIGLDKVDNTSDMDKPVSSPQRAAINALHVQALNKSDYDNLEEKDENTLYFILDE